MWGSVDSDLGRHVLPKELRSENGSGAEGRLPAKEDSEAATSKLVGVEQA